MDLSRVGSVTVRGSFIDLQGAGPLPMHAHPPASVAWLAEHLRRAVAVAPDPGARGDLARDLDLLLHRAQIDP